MGATGRGRASHLIDALTGKARRFGFFQAIRLLRRMRGGDWADDGLRFRTPPSLTYPSTAIGGIEERSDGRSWTVMVNVLGLTGPAGVLPRHYTQEMIARAVESDDAAQAFFDLFNHQLIDLYYRAWERTKLHVRHERDDPVGPARRLLAVAGLGTPGLERSLDGAAGGLTPNAAAYFAGLLGQTPRSAQAIRQLLSDLLGAPVAVEQFVGVWLTLPEQDRTRLGGGGERPRASATLGGVVLGARVWDRRSTLRVRVGPLSRAQFAAFLPDRGARSPAFRALTATLSSLLGVSARVQIQLVLKGDEVPALRLGAPPNAAPEIPGERSAPAILGISAWLAGRPSDRDADDTVFD